MPLDFNFTAGTMTNPDPAAAFAEAIRESGLPCSEQIIGDGRIHRFDIKAKGDQAGWYVLYLDGCPAGAFGSWQTGENFKWSARRKAEMSEVEKVAFEKRMETTRQKRETERERLRLKAKKRADEIWSTAGSANGHPYLKKKGVGAHGIRAVGEALVVPFFDIFDDLQSLQWIGPDGAKKFEYGGAIAGNFFIIPRKPSEVFIAEGYATAATIHETTGATVVVGFNAGNMLPVAKNIRSKFDRSAITIAADNDQFTKGNPGVTKARAAAKEIGARVVIPQFKTLSTKPTDFNDLFHLEGAETVKRQLNPSRIPSLSPEDGRVGEWLRDRPPEREALMTYRGKSALPSHIIALLAATGGTGKTYYLLSMALAASNGGSFTPFHFPRPLKTLFFSLEDDREELGRRLWDISAGGPFPDNLFVFGYPGEVGPLMELRDGNPERSEYFRWFDRELKKYGGLDLIILDTQSRFSGLSENLNEHGSAFVAGLEYLKKRHGATILLAAHTNQSSQEKPPDRMNKTMLRGATAVGDNCRLIYGMRTMTAPAAKAYGIYNRQDFIEIDLVKSNYTPDFQSSIFYKRARETGIFKYIDPFSERIEIVANALVDALSEDCGEYTVRELEKGSRAGDVVQMVSDSIDGFTRRNDVRAAIEYAERRGWIDLVERSCTKGAPKKVVRVLSSKSRIETGQNCQSQGGLFSENDG